MRHGRLMLMDVQGRELGKIPRVRLTTNAWERGRGLLGRPPLAADEGLWIRPCDSVHSLGMGYGLDLVYLDGALRVRMLVRDFCPWRLSWCPGANSVLELAAGGIEIFGIQSEMSLEWQDDEQ